MVSVYNCKNRTLSYDTIPEKRVTRRDKIMQLHQDGLNSVQISNEMNRLGIKTPRGKSYTYKNIWVTIKKWKLRELRMNDFEVTINSVAPVITIVD